MIDPTAVPEVTPDEWLARYILYSRHVRADNTVRPEAFMPHPYTDLSVTRRLMAADEEIWNVGETVADERRRTLQGRADVQASDCNAQRLQVRKAPLPGNPNHADVAGWPSEKSLQKMIALELAAISQYRQRPT